MKLHTFPPAAPQRQAAMPWATLLAAGKRMMAGLGLAAWLAGCAQPDASQTDATSTSAGDNLAATAPLPLAAPPAVPAQMSQQTWFGPQATRLTELVLHALPMDAAFEPLLDKDPNWPFAKNSSQVDATQVQCLRQRLSSAGFLDNRRQAVEEFMWHYPDQVQEAIGVLERGGAQFMAASFALGMDKKRMSNLKSGDAFGNFTLAQMSEFLDLARNDKYKPLRELLLFGGSSFPQDDRAGAEVGKNIGAKWMSQAMNYCHTPLSALQ
jgi:hypothetical protein